MGFSRENAGTGAVGGFEGSVTGDDGRTWRGGFEARIRDDPLV